MNACDLETALMRATTVGTMLTEPELCWLYGLASMAPRGAAVELGVYKGGVIVFHDYGVWKPEVTVKAAVDAWQAQVRWHSMGMVGSAIAFMRPRRQRIGGQR
jgi:hypothetical protein